jgi:hypothetical protein
LGKAPHEETVDVAAKYELDGIAESVDPELDPGYTRNDRRDMHRMGRNQELMRMFRSFSTFSFTIVLQATWEVVLLANSQGLRNGGLAGTFWSLIWTYAGFMLIVLSMAEMSSM